MDIKFGAFFILGIFFIAVTSIFVHESVHVYQVLHDDKLHQGDVCMIGLSESYINNTLVSSYGWNVVKYSDQAYFYSVMPEYEKQAYTIQFIYIILMIIAIPYLSREN